MKIIAHLVQKERHSATSSIRYREKVIAKSKASEGFLQQLRGAITKHNPLSALFARPEGTTSPFEQRLGDYTAAPSEDSFIEFSKAGTRLLALEMENQPATTGAYVVFAQHEHGAETYLLVVLLSMRASPRFNDELDLTSIETIDVDHIRHAARIRLSDVSANPEGTVYVVAKASEGVFFRKFLGIKTVEDPRVQANRIRSTLNAWADLKNYTTTRRDQLMTRGHSYWHHCWTEKLEIMTLEGMANYIYPETPEELLQFLGREEHRLAGSFTPPTPGTMKQFVKFAFDSTDLKVEFDRAKWGANVKVNGNSVVIKNAPQALRTQITTELK